MLRQQLDMVPVTVGPGAHWAHLVRYLNTFGLSPMTMQSYCSFSVGGTCAVGKALPVPPAGRESCSGSRYAIMHTARPHARARLPAGQPRHEHEPHEPAAALASCAMLSEGTWSRVCGAGRRRQQLLVRRRSAPCLPGYRCPAAMQRLVSCRGAMLAPPRLHSPAQRHHAGAERRGVRRCL